MDRCSAFFFRWVYRLVGRFPLDRNRTLVEIKPECINGAIPIHLPLAFFIAKEKFKPFMKIYFKVVAYWYCLLLVIWALIPQPLGMALVPLVLAMVLRAFYIAYDFRKVN